MEEQKSLVTSEGIKRNNTRVSMTSDEETASVLEENVKKIAEKNKDKVGAHLVQFPLEVQGSHSIVRTEMHFINGRIMLSAINGPDVDITKEVAQALKEYL